MLYVVCNRSTTDGPHQGHQLNEVQVGSKLDKATASSRAVSFEEGKAFADSHGAGFCEVSSKTRENVKTPFVEVVDQIVQKPELFPSTPSGGNTLDLGVSTISSSCPC